jgi:hypothetical protein
MNENPIQEGREILNLIKERDRSGKCVQTDYADFRAACLLPALIAETEKWQAQCIEAKAEGLLCISEEDRKAWKDGPEEDYGKYKGKKSWRAIATRELGIEAGTWKHIGPDEEDAIGFAIAELEDADYDTECHCDVLRKLLS